MPDETKTPRKRVRTGSVTTEKTVEIRKVAKGINSQGKKQEFASAGRYTSMTSDGKIADDVGYRSKIRSLRGAADALMGGDLGMKTAAGLFNDGGLGFADIADSNNIGYYSYEFPVDALELPASRAEELRFYRLAYDRDPIVGRAIDMHTELPLSKMESSKPKSSSEEFSDYIFDEFQRFQQKTNLFQVIIDACREYWTIGEAFIWVEKSNEVELCDAAKKALKRNKKQDGDGAEPGKESEFHSPLGGTGDRILDYLEPNHKASWIKKKAAIADDLEKSGIKFDPYEDINQISSEIKVSRSKLNKSTRLAAKQLGITAKSLAKIIIASENEKTLLTKLAKVVSRTNGDDVYPIQVTAAPEDAPAQGAAPLPAGETSAAGADNINPEEGAPTPEPGAPLGEAGLNDIAGADPMGGGMGGGAPMMGGGGGGMGIPSDMAGDAQQAIGIGISVSSQRELMELKHYLRLLERKKDLLEELQEIREKRKEELELFSHVTNNDYDGPDKIQILPPEQVEIGNEGTMEDGPTIYYKPPETQTKKNNHFLSLHHIFACAYCMCQL